MDDAQLLKGILEGCVLEIIKRGETYGYEILSCLGEYGFHNLVEGTLYPVLTRLHKKELIRCRKQKSPLGPVRKYYEITDKGVLYLNEFKKQYQMITKIATSILLEDPQQMEKETEES